MTATDYVRVLNLNKPLFADAHARHARNLEAATKLILGINEALRTGDGSYLPVLESLPDSLDAVNATVRRLAYEIRNAHDENVARIAAEAEAVA